MAFLNNRTSFYIVLGVIFLAILGIISKLINDPTGFLKSIAVMLIVGVIIYMLVRRFYGANPQKREQQAFRKAAKRSKRRFLTKDVQKASPRVGALSTIKKANNKKKSNTHLTVIEGKKGKKKNRASF
ncbi:SA1362 family protein (plasmid) [Bacillus sp. 31A1R]|uniref:SA1362 family protein n=1 Tax=Robertmurraya mangrovi TaxID=3098077 RepID=A0ABU5IV70_9BACI|nr:SA1362 family protein [Bacillus sp. 31A1R]MDZ5471035.1 SA1362 family protein [Bacillus sp. 31A1R]